MQEKLEKNIFQMWKDDSQWFFEAEISNDFKTL